jgi:uncharacterized protein YegL
MVTWFKCGRWRVVPLAVLLPAAIASLMGVGEGGVAARPPRQAASGPCTAIHDARVAPPAVLLGETVDVTLTLRPACPDDMPLHIVLVLDSSGSMAGEPERELRKAARSMVNGLGLADHPSWRVGVVMFNSSARILCALANREGQVNGCIGRVSAAGGTNVAAGINAGIRVLVDGRKDYPADPIREVMVVVTNGGDPADCAATQEAADRAKAEGVLLIGVCMGEGCDAQCLQRAATDPRFFYQARSMSEMMGVFTRIGSHMPGTAYLSLTVVGRVPANLLLVEDSAEPEPQEISPNRDELRWTIDYPPTELITLSWRVLPLEVGLHGVGVSSFGMGPIGAPPTLDVDFDEPRVLVLLPRELATVTPGGPVTTPSPTATANATPIPTGTPGPRDPKGLFFPVAIRNLAWR